MPSLSNLWTWNEIPKEYIPQAVYEKDELDWASNFCAVSLTRILCKFLDILVA